jgi:predicted AAA+ superfamily ATPase
MACLRCAQIDGRAKRWDTLGALFQAVDPMAETDIEPLLARIAEALERLAPAPEADADAHAADAFVWHPTGNRLEAIVKVNRVDLSLLKGIDRARP